jgi:hypothetical protein
MYDSGLSLMLDCPIDCTACHNTHTNTHTSEGPDACWSEGASPAEGRQGVAAALAPSGAKQPRLLLPCCCFVSRLVLWPCQLQEDIQTAQCHNSLQGKELAAMDD